MHVCVCGLAFQRPDLKFVCARSLARVLVFVCWCWNELAHLQKKLDVVFKLLLDMQGAGAQKNPVSFVPHIAEDMRRSQAQAPPQAHAPLLPSPSPLLPPLSDASPLPAAVHFDTRHASADTQAASNNSNNSNNSALGRVITPSGGMLHPVLLAVDTSS